MCPFENKSAELSYVVAVRTGKGLSVDVERVVGNAGMSIECKLKCICQLDRLIEKSINIGALREQLASYCHQYLSKLAFVANFASGPLSKSYPDSIPAR